MIKIQHLSDSQFQAQVWLKFYMEEYPTEGYGTIGTITPIKVPALDEKGKTIQVTKYQIEVERFDSCD
jgi:hypothetical protein